MCTFSVPPEVKCPDLAAPKGAKKGYHAYATTGKNLQIVCTVQANPKANITWRINDTDHTTPTDLENLKISNEVKKKSPFFLHAPILMLFFVFVVLFSRSQA